MTECINPTEIQEGDWLAYAEGEANPAVQDHVQRCAYCAERAAVYSRLDQWLLAGLYRTSCLAPDTLARWQLHLLPADEELSVAAHVRTCPHCASELEELAAVDDDLRSALLDRLRGVSRWLEATLVTAAPRPVGLRGGPVPQRRYRAGDLDIFVGSQIESVGRRLIGRLRPPANQRAGAVGVEVWLVQGGQALDSRFTDDLGHFVFPAVAPGQYDLGFDWQGQAVLIRGVEV
jgi:hypothetical protein